MSEQELHPQSTASDGEVGKDTADPEPSAEPPVEAEQTPVSTGHLAGLDSRVQSVRQNATKRRLALAIAVLVGLLATTWHWFGLVLGGALVGLTRQTLPRALAAGFGFGWLVLGGFLVTLQLSAGITPTELVALAPLSTLTVVLTLLAPTWGALLRGAI